MFCLNKAVTVEWVLDKTGVVITAPDLLVRIKEPDGTTSFNAVQNLTAPTVDTEGNTVYTITPDAVGFWRVTLINGTAASYKEYSTVEMWVFDNDTLVEPLSYGDGSLAL